MSTNIGSLTGKLTAQEVDGVNDSIIAWDDSRAGKDRSREMSLNEVRTYVLSGSAGQLGITVDGAGAPINTGTKGYLRVPYNCMVASSEIVADQSGSMVIDIWKDTYANFPPLDADSITGPTPPTLSGAQKSADSTLSGWTTSLAEGDYLGFNVDSSTSCTRATLTLKVTKTSI